ncbi:hypothetical protein BJ322DRAFT_1042304 [Thelephora terrestris]|uniref:Splicing factor 3B subunit 1 domain-containing protein n=1 Tax=Thelephora terrestris TaxID=56493 RepID=A0A9P6HKT1_9AGAM|nr:hypothetical protein BJ322DRAFT_1042304 [Thelephora terrestris]
MSAPSSPRSVDSFTAPKEVLREFADLAEEDDIDPFAETAKTRQIAARQSDYHLRRFDHSAHDSTDAFAAQQDGTEVEGGYKDAMRLQRLEKEEARVRKPIEDKEKQDREEGGDKMDLARTPPRAELDEAEKILVEVAAAAASSGKKKRRWDVGNGAGETTDVKMEENEPPADAAPKKRRSRWDAAPMTDANDAPKRSRWDQTPHQIPNDTPMVQIIMNAPGFMQDDKHNCYLTDEELDALLPTSGYLIVAPPPGYAPAVAPRKLQATPPELPTEIPSVGNLAFFKAEDAQYFAKIPKEEDETELSIYEMKERKIMRLLLKIKNGTPPVRKTALQQITDKARKFGAGPLFDKILPLLMERTLEDQERHLLVKVIDRVLYKLDDLVRPYVHRILVVIEPLLIDEASYARVEGREIISNLSKAAGLAHMISTMRPDINHADEYVRNTTARAFSVVASALGSTYWRPDYPTNRHHDGMRRPTPPQESC